MKTSARIQAVIDILDRIQSSRVPMDNTIRDYMKNRRYIGSKDRKAIVEMAYDIVRATARLNWWFEKQKVEASPRMEVAFYLMLSDQSFTEVSQYFNGERHAPEALSSDEEKVLQEIDGKLLDDDAMPEDVLAECPSWAADRLKSMWGDDFLGQMQAMMVPASLDLRVNTLKIDVDNAQNSLAKDGVETVKTEYSPVGLRAVGKPYMSATKAFHKGWIEIQDEGSQLIASLCGVQPGMRVLDYCAGGGGKTLALAAAMEGKGIIFAMDNSTRRLEQGRRRYRKADVHNVEVRSLEEEKHRKWFRRQKDAMDVVLVDAPCSSSGTWRRNPDLRWNQHGPSLDEIKEAQADILRRVADKVKPGGRLVYATCSLFREENEDQVEAFLKEHDNYDLLSPADIHGGGNVSALNDYMRLTPKDHGTDGFFTAVMIRK